MHPEWLQPILTAIYINNNNNKISRLKSLTYMFFTNRALDNSKINLNIQLTYTIGVDNRNYYVTPDIHCGTQAVGIARKYIQFSYPQISVKRTTPVLRDLEFITIQH